MRFPSLLIAFAIGLTAACGPTVLIPGEIDGDSTSGSGASGNGAAGTGASGTGAAGTGASGTGAAGTGAAGTGAAGTGASGTGASGTGAGGPGSSQWGAAFGGDGHQHLKGLAANAAAEVILGGTFDGELDFGFGSLAQTGLRSGFVAKLGPSGKAAWAVSLTAENCSVESVAASPEGFVYATGFVKGALHVGGQLISSGDGIFLAQLDGASGALVWAQTFGSSASMQADRGLSVAAVSGGVLMSGSFAGALDFGLGPLGGGGAFVASFDVGGKPFAASALSGKAAFVGVGPDLGHVVVAINGENDTMSAVALTGVGASVQWKHDYGPGAFTAVAVDGVGNAYFTGHTTTADFGGGPLPSPLPNGEGFLLGLDTAGNHRFTRGLPFDKWQSTAAAIALDASSAIAVTGNYVHHVDSSTPIKSVFFATFDAYGTPNKSLTFGPLDGFGSAITQEGFAVAPGPKPGSFYLGGDFYTQIDIGGASLTGGGTSDLFVARLPP